jgi:Tol biopolymer transport system component
VSVAIADKAGATKSVSAQTGDFYSPRASPDGERIAITVREAVGRTDVWIYEIGTGQLTPMTRDAVSQYPEWADARRVVFRYNPLSRSGQYMVQPWDHSAAATPFLGPAPLTGTSGVYGLSLGPSTGYLALMRTPGGPASRAKRQDIHIAPMRSPADQTELVATDASELSPRVSPNGRWLAYTSNESGVFQVYVLPVPGPGPRVPVSIDHGIEPVWSRDGRTLFYVSHNTLLAAHVDESSGFRATRQDTLFNFTERGFAMHPPNTRGPAPGSYDVFPNGDFAVLVRASTDSSRSSIVALLHWQQLLKRVASGKQR